MKRTYLFPTVFRKIGWYMLLPFVVANLVSLSDKGWNENWLEVTTFSIAPWGFITNSLCDEVSLIGLTLSLLFIAFSREKDEDECIASIRSASLTWATLIGYVLLMLCTLFIYGLAYLTFVFIDLFAILVLFILKYNIELYKFRRNHP